MDARDGLAVVPIVGSGCGRCGAHIPPQTLTEVRAKKEYTVAIFVGDFYIMKKK